MSFSDLFIHVEGARSEVGLPVRGLASLFAGRPTMDRNEAE